MLTAFRLPGESQQIDRIAETFAETYFAAQPGILPLPCPDVGHLLDAAEIKNQDAVHVLAYSIIMLNTDQHNRQIRVSPQSGVDSAA